MRRLPIALVAGLGLTSWIAGSLAGGHGCTGCTGGCHECVPACRATWDEHPTTEPSYSMTCSYEGVRGRDSWRSPSPECRCQPPAGDVIVKKRVYKTNGPERIERVPKYEVVMVSPPCDCDRCTGHDGLCWWNPFAMIRHCLSGR